MIANVDKHEDQVDIIEQALFGRSRAMLLEKEIKRTTPVEAKLEESKVNSPQKIVPES